MVPGCFPFKIVSNSPALHSRWPLLLKVEISSNGQNCSILSQNVPKFELYKHNDELFNMYDRIFYELWTFADFDRLCKLEKKGGWNLKKIFSALHSRWLLLLKIEISSIVHCCFSISQNELKFELQRHGKE